MNLIKNKAFKNINKFKDILEHQGIRCGKIIEKKFNYEIEINSNGKKFKLLVYFGKKGVKNVLQGNSNLKEYFMIKEIVDENYDLFNHIENIVEPDEYIGTDESGKGDIFGPLVAAAVYVNSKTREELKKKGVQDSKNLSSSEIKRLAKVIVQTVDNKYSVKKLEPEKYNKMYDELKNMNRLLWKLHSEAIKELLGKVKCNFVITDKFQKKELFLGEPSGYSVKFLQEYKGEKYTGVAAASILARAEVIKWFEANKILNKELPKGASQKAEKFLEWVLTKISRKDLIKFAKMNFKSLKKFDNK